MYQQYYGGTTILTLNLTTFVICLINYEWLSKVVGHTS